LLLGGKYGDKMHIWDLDKRRPLQELDMGAEQKMVFESYITEACMSSPIAAGFRETVHREGHRGLRERL
jgi:hypothetical protein